MQSPFKKIAQATLEFFILVFLALLPVFSVYSDLIILGNDLGEISITEITQEALLLASAFIFWHGAWKKPEIRGLLVLIAGFFSCLFIREMDSFLDEIRHGFWFWPALVMALSAIVYARFLAGNTTLKPLTDFINTKPYFLMVIGMIILIILSRTFGSGNLFWNHLLPDGDAFLAKTIVQEGLELLGYGFIFYGALVFNYRNYVSFLSVAPSQDSSRAGH